MVNREFVTVFPRLKFGVASVFLAMIGLSAGDHVLIASRSTSTRFAVALASLIRGAQYTLLIRGNNTDTSRKQTVMTDISGFVDRWLYKNCTRIVAVGQDTKDGLEKKTMGLVTSIDVIPDKSEEFAIEPAIARYRTARSQ